MDFVAQFLQAQFEITNTWADLWLYTFSLPNIGQDSNLIKGDHDKTYVLWWFWDSKDIINIKNLVQYLAHKCSINISY